jgi:hypothetical protein
MRPTSGSRASGCIYTGLWIRAVRRSTSYSRPNAMQQRLSAFWPKPWAVRTIRRRGSSIPTSTPLIHPPLPGSKPQAIWPTIANTAPCSISITSWNRITGRSSVGSTRVSIFAHSGEVGARWLRGDPYDPQRPGVRECDGHRVRFVAPLRSWYVWNRCLIHLVIAPTWPSISQLQHYLRDVFLLDSLSRPQKCRSDELQIGWRILP